MKITFETLHNSWDALLKLCAAPMPDPVVALRLRLFWLAAAPKYNAFSEGLIPLMLQHGATQVGPQLVVPAENLAEFRIQAKSLFVEEVELPDLKLKISTLPRGVFSAFDLDRLTWLIDLKEEQKT